MNPGTPTQPVPAEETRPNGLEAVSCPPSQDAAKPADATPQEWAAAVRLTFATARSLSALQGIPSHWLEAMRDCALRAPEVDRG